MSGIKRTAADARFSDEVRERDGWMCVYCGRAFVPYQAQGLHAAHIFGRAIKATRLDLDNAISLCYGHHRWFTAHPASFMEFVEKHLGPDRLEALSARAHAKRDR